ncbi:response regulator [Pelotomaculum propionicicum]|uniref:response regulator n=1 Tax=Pelotomaculum propionicicum TaxID=258475 RepID=UPI003B8053A1
MSKKIMIVDDSSFARKMIKDILVSEGYEVIGEFESGGASVDEYTRLKPDLVTMDIIMHEMSGIDALERILTIDKDARVIIVSFMNNNDSIKKSLQAGALDFVTKPFSRERLLEAVEKALERK